MVKPSQRRDMAQRAVSEKSVSIHWNHKRVYRIYRELGLNLRIKPRKRLVREKPQPPVVPEAINVCWSMDFMHDQLSDGRNYRLLNVGVVEKRHLRAG